MKYLFTKGPLRQLQALPFSETLFAFDFDGTLAPLTKDPALAHLPPITAELLRVLSQLSPVALISGRSESDLKEKCHGLSVFCIGNHGLEGPSPEGTNEIEELFEIQQNRDHLDHWRNICRSWKNQLAGEISPLGAGSGAGPFLEDKKYSLSLHYRNCQNKNQVRQHLQVLVENIRPSPRVISGKSVINLLPPLAPHKGSALLNLMATLKLKRAFYIGDDDTDEDVFLLGHSPHSGLMTVRVGKKKKSQAQYFIKRQSEINHLLEGISGKRGISSRSKAPQ